MGIFSKKDKDQPKSADAKAAKDKATKKNTSKNSTKDLYKDGGSDKKVKSIPAEAKKESPKKKSNGQAYRILVRPLITEKAANQAEVGKYFFEVALDANKIEVAKAVEEIYNVKPISVNIIKVNGKRKRHGRIMGKRKDWKKAIVSLKKGDSIKIYEGV